jgi:ATP-dependent Clp protease ATP-binding subunit ClpB
MSEYQEKFSISKVLGSPAGYVGCKEGSGLTNYLKNNPNGIVLLDEIEKANTDVLQVFLSTFDEGRITPSLGETIHCNNAIFILTSNVGSSILEELSKLDHASLLRNIKPKNPMIDEFQLGITSKIEHELKSKMPIEFLGRIDEIVPFLSIEHSHIKSILLSNLDCWKKFAQENHAVELEFEKDVEELIIRQFNPTFGVRSLQNLLEKLVGSLLAEASFTDQLQPGSRIAITKHKSYNKLIIVKK